MRVATEQQPLIQDVICTLHEMKHATPYELSQKLGITERSAREQLYILKQQNYAAWFHDNGRHAWRLTL